ncbi:hypothetical protein JTB14_033685 [Gonioctena quinquepunctata]|nr:hypothetical protein JTB14_033685 [Gonioctena quinquepunctata]
METPTTVPWTGRITYEPTIIISMDNLPSFNGTTDIKDFISEIEYLAAVARWTDSQISSIVRLKLTGIARLFIDTDDKLKNTINWPEFKKELLQQFSRLKLPGEEEKEFLNCYQKNSESVRNFSIRLRASAAKLRKFTGINRVDDVLKQKFEQDTLVQFCIGLIDPVRKKVLSASPVSLKEAIKLAEKEELIETLTAQTNMNFRNFNTNKIVCTHCNRKGHEESNCKKKNCVCYHCEEFGHLSYRCPNRNSFRNEILSESGPWFSDYAKGNRFRKFRKIKKPRKGFLTIQWKIDFELREE